MEPRITRLEALSDITVQRLGHIETDVALLKTDVGVLKSDVFTLKMDVHAIKSNYATKADIGELKAAIGEAKASIIMWIVSAMFIAQLMPTFLKKLGL